MNLLKDWLFWISVISLIIGLLLCSGCFKGDVIDPLPTTAAETFTKIIYKTNWLVTVGILACAFGVITTINGGTKGIAIIGGGLTVIALVLTLARWGTWITGALAILLIAGIVGVVFTAADINGDGKVNLQDLKQLFRWK